MHLLGDTEGSGGYHTEGLGLGEGLTEGSSGRLGLGLRFADVGNATKAIKRCNVKK